MKGLSIMAKVACHAVLVASVKEVCWPSGKQSLDMNVETWGSARGEQSKVMRGELPWWTIGKNCTFQSSGCGFNPWPGS